MTTQERFGNGQQVTQYKLQYSNDGKSVQVFKQGENTDKVKMYPLYKKKINNNNNKKQKAAGVRSGTPPDNVCRERNFLYSQAQRLI